MSLDTWKIAGPRPAAVASMMTAMCRGQRLKSNFVEVYSLDRARFQRVFRRSIIWTPGWYRKPARAAGSALSVDALIDAASCVIDSRGEHGLLPVRIELFGTSCSVPLAVFFDLTFVQRPRTSGGEGAVGPSSLSVRCSVWSVQPLARS